MCVTSTPMSAGIAEEPIRSQNAVPGLGIVVPGLGMVAPPPFQVAVNRSRRSRNSQCQAYSGDDILLSNVCSIL